MFGCSALDRDRATSGPHALRPAEPTKGRHLRLCSTAHWSRQDAQSRRQGGMPRPQKVAESGRTSVVNCLLIASPRVAVAASWRRSQYLRRYGALGLPWRHDMEQLSPLADAVSRGRIIR